MEVKSGHVKMESQLISPSNCWYWIVSEAWMVSGRFDGGILSTGKPLIKGVALFDKLQLRRLSLSRRSRINASWWTWHCRWPF